MIKTRGEFGRVVRLLVGFLPQMVERGAVEDVEQVYGFAELFCSGNWSLPDKRAAERLLSIWDPFFKAEKAVEHLEAIFTDLNNAVALRKGLARMSLIEKRAARSARG